MIYRPQKFNVQGYVIGSERVLRQRLVLEECGATIQYIQGEKNVVADALSRVPNTMNTTYEE